jgi:hypothetical protein
MSLRDDFLQRLAPEYAWTRLDAEGQRYLITHHRGHPLRLPVRLHLLTEDLFERYAGDLARTCEDGNVGAALGLMFVHVDEEVTVDSQTVVTDVGLKPRHLGKPAWFTRRIPPDQVDSEPSYVWVLDPPNA